MDDPTTKPKRVSAPPDKSPALSAGMRFGRYQILSPLGAGGMGEVYRALDPRLGRELAIKVLSSKLSAQEQDLARFEQEARSASALNHPNIVTIFELGQVDHTYYIAMELVEGVQLRDLLRAGAFPLQKSIPIAAQIADGLAKAHEAGVVHRDLKPENLMVSRDGFVKILDFGLAKLVRSSINGSKTEDTAITSLTDAGSLIGTVEYMSPEQANGLPLDFSSDQFSFGSVLYEMVTGKRGFQRRSPAETIAAILRDDLEPVAALNPLAPAPLCWVIERCLAKNPKDRYASTRDLARDLANIRERLSEAPSRHALPRAGILPARRIACIGRNHEIATVKDLLQREEVRLITLTGPGGIGKTCLGLEIAGEVEEHFPGGVCFIPLGAVSDSALVPSIIAQSLGMREPGRQANLESLKEFLTDLRASVLLFFDNFEHLLSAAPVLAELIAVAPRFKLLVTSRSPLHISGELEFQVPPLALPDPRSAPSLDELAQIPTIALFLARAMAVKPKFELTAENALAVATICTRLDGLPLAIELAAARIKLLSPSALQARLESRLQILTGGAKDLPLRQQTLRGTIDWSYGLLSEAEQALFRRLAVFAGGCTLEGVEAVCNTKQDLEVDVLDGMGSLVDKSLIQHLETSQAESRFVLLDTIREYAMERLTAAGEESATRRAHAAYCMVLAEEFASNIADPAQTNWANSFEADHDNFLAALDWLTHKGDADWGLRLGAALFQFWDTREYLTEGRDRLGKLLALPGADPRSNTRSRAFLAASVLATGQGDYAAAKTLAEESLGIARELNDGRGVGIAINALAVIARDRGDHAASRALFEESLEVWRGIGDPVVVARALSNLANVLKLCGDYAAARSLHEESRAIFHELGDNAGIAWSFNYEGDVAREQGQNEVAQALYQQSLNIFRALDDKWGIAGCLVDLGTLARDRGDDGISRANYEESMKLFQELGQKRGIARLLDCVACSAALKSEPERALRLAGAAAAIRRVLGASLALAENARLEKTLDLARQSLSPTMASAAWMDGWTMPVDKAIQDAFSHQ